MAEELIIYILIQISKEIQVILHWPGEPHLYPTLGTTIQTGQCQIWLNSKEDKQGEESGNQVLWGSDKGSGYI